MTRDELIEELKKLPRNDDVTVWIDGCEYDIERVDNSPRFRIIIDE